ncbi:MAG: DNA polymerase III subunit gamma/tau [Bacteroidales bacterium]|nr:DNA polymerase III subunit gamma/tau [Bacteroidales bacterium]
MEQFIVSARKYRPESFESLFGQGNISTTLKNSIIRGQLAHAYLFCGPRGVGKTTTARIFAKSINCLSPLEGMEPCGQCESCLSFAEGRSYCIHELDAASNNSVDDIRNLTEMVRIPPQIGKYSVYIIDEVHMLSSAAFNAFLKTLEEPPAHAIFILATTEKHKILPTILSRCQTYDFNRISIPDIVRNLSEIAQKENIAIDTESLHVIAVKGDGSMRDSLTLFDQTVAFCGKEIKYEDVIRNLNVLDYEYYFKIIDNSLRGDYISSLLLFDEILSKGFNALHFISGLSAHLRDLIVCKHSAAQALLSLPETLIKRYRNQAEHCSIGFIYQALNITTTCEAGYRQSGNQRLHIEFALMKLAEKFIPAGTAAESVPVTPAVAVPATQTTTAQPKATTSTAAQSPASTAQSVVPDVQNTTSAPISQSAEKPVIQASEPAAAPVAQTSSPANNQEVPANTPAVQTPGISLTAMLSRAQRSANNPGQDASVLLDEDLDHDKINQAWKWLAEQERKENRTSLAATMLMKELEIDLEKKSIKFYVNNIAQRDWIREKALPRMERMLKDFLRNNKIHIEIDVIDVPVEKKEILYTPTQKGEFLLTNHPEVKELKNDFKLEIK